MRLTTSLSIVSYAFHGFFVFILSIIMKTHRLFLITRILFEQSNENIGRAALTLNTGQKKWVHFQDKLQIDQLWRTTIPIP